MFNFIQELFGKYIDNVTRYDIHSITVERGENPEDLYYLCEIKNTFYVVYETDYIGSLTSIVKEASNIFETYELFPIYWLVKKDNQESIGSHISIEGSTDKLLREAITLKSNESYLKYLVLEFRSKSLQPKHYNPTIYGQMN